MTPPHFLHITSEQIERDKGVRQMGREISGNVTYRADREYVLDTWQHGIPKAVT